MSLSQREITTSDISTYGVQSQPDKLTGTAQQNKVAFDQLITNAVKAKHNGIITDLTASTGANEIGASVTDMEGTTVGAILTEMKGLVDDNTEVAHSHSNKSLLDDISAEDVNTWDTVTSKESSSNKVTSMSSASTDTQYPSAKAVYNSIIGSGTGAVQSVNGKIGSVVLTSSDVGAEIKKITISLPTASWTGASSPYSQVILVTGSTANSKIDLQPDSTAIAQMVEDGCSALYVANNNNTLTAYAVGEKPTADLSIQGTIYEVTV